MPEAVLLGPLDFSQAADILKRIEGHMGHIFNPDILEALERLSQGLTGPSRNVVIVPIGFVADHLEILYDIDVEARQFAEAHHLNLIRTESLNTSPTFIAALADIVQNKLS